MDSLSVAGQRLLLHIEDETARLGADELGIKLALWHRCELQLNSMFPAKGEGFCELRLFDPTTDKLAASLLFGRFENLD